MEAKTRVPEELQAAIVGMVLGDASIGLTGRLTCTHSIRQKKYAVYKAGILRLVTHVQFRESEGRVDKRTGKTYPHVDFATRQHPLYKKLRLAFYPNGHKVVDPFWLNKLDERGFALWYFDDGTTGEYKSYLATLSFSWPENHLISRFLWERFQLHADVRRWDKGKPIIRFPAKSRPRLLELLAPYADDCGFGYKLPNVHPLPGANLRFAKTGKPRGWYPKGDDTVRSPEQSGS